MLTGVMCKIARRGLGIQQDDFAKSAKIAIRTLVDFEEGRRTPRELTLDSIAHVFADRGVAFTEDAVIIPIPPEQMEPTSG